MPNERIIVCGDRYWKDEALIEEKLTPFSMDTVIIHGDYRGADRIADKIARKLHFIILKYPAEWHAKGKSAGPARNLLMLSQKPTRVIAFHDNIESSKGTKHMISLAIHTGIPYEIIKHAD